MDYSFKLDSEVNKELQRVLAAAKQLEAERQRILHAMMGHIRYGNILYRCALAEARLERQELQNVDFPKELITMDGKMAVKIDNNVVTWTSHDEKVEGDKQSGKD